MSRGAWDGSVSSEATSSPQSSSETASPETTGTTSETSQSAMMEPSTTTTAATASLSTAASPGHLSSSSTPGSPNTTETGSSMNNLIDTSQQPGVIGTGSEMIDTTANTTADLVHGISTTMTVSTTFSSTFDQGEGSNTSFSTESDTVLPTSSITNSLFNETSSSSETITTISGNTSSADSQAIDNVNTTSKETSTSATTDVSSAVDTSELPGTNGSSVPPSLSLTSPTSLLSTGGISSTSDGGVSSDSSAEASTRALTSDTSHAETDSTTLGPAGQTTITDRTSGQDLSDTSPQESTTIMAPPSYASRPTTTTNATTAPPGDVTTAAAPSTTSTTINILSTTYSSSAVPVSVESTQETPSQASPGASNTTYQPVSETSSSSQTPEMSPSFSTEQLPPQTSQTIYLTSPSSTSGTPNQTRKPNGRNQSDFSFNEDVILVEKIRLVFLGNYENDTIFAKEVKETLNKFLLAATRLQKSKAGTDWWFELSVIGQPQQYQNQSTLLDFRIRHTSGEEIIDTFERYQLKKYFKDKVNLSLVAECRPSENCQESPLSSASKDASSFWEHNAPVFITVLVLFAIIFLVVMVGLLGGKCRDRWWRRGTYNASRDDYEAYDTKPLSEQTKLRPVSGVSGGLSSPFPDDHITQNEADTNHLKDAAEQETALLTGDDNANAEVNDNTWVIPLEDAPSHHSNGHSGPITTTTSAPTPTAKSATTTVQGRNDAFVSTRF
ncbi:hypothetical protein ElyMa_000352700 [Elysia marginata]|uniref:SEA domain-containing protein n=1 Tax=Elysia marginata TaxID=1093978 RepID=A0AAV4FDC8_9GAST|nr:hypothetical protein ElyMa_000352700 [Elysia marginata]